MKKVFVSPSILSADFSRLGEECKNLEKCGADWIHCDVMDGVFVPNITIGMNVIQSMRKCVVLPMDVHLMVQKPDRYAVSFAESGASIITVHVESDCDVKATSDAVHNAGKKFGLSVKPNTPVSALEKYRGLFDLILIMTVEPGFGGQKLLDDCIEKIAVARRLFPEALIEVDGGVTTENAPVLIAKGADVLVAGYAVFSAENRQKAIETIRGEN